MQRRGAWHVGRLFVDQRRLRCLAHLQQSKFETKRTKNIFAVCSCGSEACGRETKQKATAKRMGPMFPFWASRRSHSHVSKSSTGEASHARSILARGFRISDGSVGLCLSSAFDLAASATGPPRPKPLLLGKLRQGASTVPADELPNMSMQACRGPCPAVHATEGLRASGKGSDARRSSGQRATAVMKRKAPALSEFRTVEPVAATRISGRDLQR